MLTWIRRNVTATIVFALVLVAAMSSTAAAGHLLTGKDIKNGSITGQDLKDGSVAAQDLSRGTGIGAQGPAGPQGGTGPQGPQGAPGPGLAGTGCTIPGRGAGTVSVQTAPNGAVTLFCALSPINAQDIDQDADGFRRSSDCNDHKVDARPTATEVVGNGYDDDCDGLADEDTANNPNATDDSDGDADGQSVVAGDCDDHDATSKRGATDPFGDGYDQDCNGYDG